MAIKLDYTDQYGQVFGYWVVKTATQYYDLKKIEVNVVGYKNKASYLDNKQGILKKIDIVEGSGWQTNMTLNEIEDAVIVHLDFAGSTKTT